MSIRAEWGRASASPAIDGGSDVTVPLSSVPAPPESEHLGTELGEMAKRYKPVLGASLHGTELHLRLSSDADAGELSAEVTRAIGRHESDARQRLEQRRLDDEQLGKDQGTAAERAADL